MRGHQHINGFSYHHGVFRTLNDPAATASTDPQCGNDLSRIAGFYAGKKGTTGFKFTPGGAAGALPGDMPGAGEPGASSGRMPASPRFGRL